MTIEKTEFTFPDETEVVLDKGATEKTASETDIEVVDDTPAQDRNRKPMAEAPADPTDDELASYSDTVKKRIQHFTKGYHEERRAKEAAQREKDEALRLAQSVIDENKRLQGSLSQGQQALLEQAKRVVAQEMEQAKAAMKAAAESFDTDAMVAAQEKMMEAQLKAEKVKNYRPAPVQTREDVVQTPQQAQPAGQADPKAAAWMQKNRWFGEDEEMSSFALGVHNKLVRTGVDPTSDDYYAKLDSRMREVFSDRFESENPGAARQTSNNVVAAATRSTAPKKVVLTKTQVDIAKRLGVPLELYARKVAEGMRS